MSYRLINNIKKAICFILKHEVEEGFGISGNVYVFCKRCGKFMGWRKHGN